MSKRCRQNGKQCTSWSDCSKSSLDRVYTVCIDLPIRKLRIITVFCQAHCVALCSDIFSCMTLNCVSTFSWMLGTGRNEPPRDETNKMACAPCEDSDQPGHLPSLIRVFAVRMKKAWVLSYPLSTQRRLIRWAHRSVCWFCHEVAHFKTIHHLNNEGSDC